MIIGGKRTLKFIVVSFLNSLSAMRLLPFLYTSAKPFPRSYRAALRQNSILNYTYGLHNTPFEYRAATCVRA